MESLETLALAELAEHLAAAERLAAQYALDYCAAFREGKLKPRPKGLHPQIAKLVREVVLDAAVIARRAP